RTPPATSALSTLSLHDALPIWNCWQTPDRAGGPLGGGRSPAFPPARRRAGRRGPRRGTLTGRDVLIEPIWGSGDSRHGEATAEEDRKSTRLNSSHGSISYAVFC